MLKLLGKEYRRLFFRSPLRLLLILSYCLLGLWSVMDGVAWRQATLRAQDARPAELLVDREAWTKELAEVESGKEASPRKAQPMNLTLLALLPPGPLSHLAHRGESIHPSTALLSGWKSEASLFRRYEIEGPVPLSMIGLDLSYLVVVLFPLVLLLCTFDALSAELESGRLKLLMVQGVSVPELVTARIVAVFSLLLSATFLIAVGATLAMAQGTKGLGLWLLCTTGYALFWGGASMWLATRFRRRVDVALAALGSWIFLVLLVPAAIQFAAEALYPVPSRVEYLTNARVAEAEARREIEERAEVYMAEHEVELGEGADKIPDFFRKYFIANEHIHKKTSTLIRTLENQRQAQSLVANRLEFVAPPLLASRLLSQFSGTGSERAAHYRQQVRAHLGIIHKGIGPATVAKRRISLAQARAIPDFRFQEPAPTLSPAIGIGLLYFLGCGLLFSAFRRARRVSPLFGG